jgi:hypothetical protein
MIDWLETIPTKVEIRRQENILVSGVVSHHFKDFS